MEAVAKAAHEQHHWRSLCAVPILLQAVEVVDLLLELFAAFFLRLRAMADAATFAASVSVLASESSCGTCTT